MRNGKIFAMFQPNMVGEMQMVVRFVDKRRNSTENSTFHSAHSRRSALNQHIREQANVKKIVTAENLKFAVTVCFKITGLRRVRISQTLVPSQVPKSLMLKSFPLLQSI